MKAISLWEPWALLCLVTREGRALKEFETRDWSTAYRGPLVIHAAKTVNAEVRIMAGSANIAGLLRSHYRPDYLGIDDLPLGALIGTVELVDCQRMRLVPAPTVLEDSLGNWRPERFAWKLAKPKLFASPIPYKGLQRFFNVPDTLVT